MKNQFMKRAIALAMAATLTATLVPVSQFTPTTVQAAGASDEAKAAKTVLGTNKGGSYKPDSLTIQPGEKVSEINLNWYAPVGATESIIDFGGTQYHATVADLTTPTEVKTDKYTDTGKKSCKITIKNLKSQTSYMYQISNDGGATWSKAYIYTTPASDRFTFGFTSDPQIKNSNETNNKGWNPDDGTNQTGWATMMKKLAEENVNLVVSAGDQVEDQSWGNSSEYTSFFAPEEMGSIAYAPAVGNHDRHYMFADHFNLPNEMAIAETGSNNVLGEVKTTFRGQNSGTSQSHGNYIQATADEIAKNNSSNGVAPNADGKYDYVERREMETKGNYYYLYNNVLFVTLNTGAYPGGNDALEGENVSVTSSMKNNEEAEAIVKNFKTTMSAATSEFAGQYKWMIVTHHKSTETVAKHVADSDIENYVDAGFEKLMDEFDVDFVLGGHDHVYSRSYVLKDGKRNYAGVDDMTDVDGTIYITGNCCSDMQYYTPFEKVDKSNNVDYPVLADGSKGSANYMAGKLPIGNYKWNQEFSPSYAIFDVTDNKISVNVYNLDGDSTNPSSKKIDTFSVSKTPKTVTQPTGPDTGDQSGAGNQGGTGDQGNTGNQGAGTTNTAANTSTATTTDWSASVNELTNASNNATVTIKVDNSGKVSKDALAAIKGTNKKAVFDLGNGIKWTIKGSDISKVSADDLDLSINLGTKNVPESAIKDSELSKKEVIKTVQMNLDHDGEFGFVGTATIPMGKEYAGKYANLYYYDPETKELKGQMSGLIDKDGNVEFLFNHASDYVISITDKSTLTTSPKMGDNNQVAVYLLFLGMGAVVIAAGLIKRKKTQIG